jgi:chaperone BCS1
MEEELGNNGGFGMDSLQMMGIMNAFKTGDVQTDMLIAMCIPLLLRFLFGAIGQLDGKFDMQTWLQWWRGENSHKYERFITHSTTRNYWGGTSSLDDDTQNSVLLKAIKLYLHQVVKLNLTRAYLDLTGMEDKNSSYGRSSEYDYDSDDDSEYGASRSRKTLVGMLSRYNIVKNLPEQQWHELGEYGSPASMVELRIENATHEEEKGKNTKLEINSTTFHFTSSGDGAIDAFIDIAYQWYLGELRTFEDNSRYLYELKIKEIKLVGGNSDNDSGGDEGFSYKRYKLSDHKTFESLFFRQKEGLLNIIQHFTEKTGKYAIKGYPHKLGVLLHGPPGTGKTSLSKSLYQWDDGYFQRFHLLTF